MFLSHIFCSPVSDAAFLFFFFSTILHKSMSLQSLEWSNWHYKCFCLWSRPWLSFPCVPGGCDPVACLTSLGHSVLLHAAHAGDRQPGKSGGLLMICSWADLNIFKAVTVQVAHLCSSQHDKSPADSPFVDRRGWADISCQVFLNAALSPPTVCPPALLWGFFIFCVIWIRSRWPWPRTLQSERKKLQLCSKCHSNCAFPYYLRGSQKRLCSVNRVITTMFSL